MTDAMVPSVIESGGGLNPPPLFTPDGEQILPVKFENHFKKDQVDDAANNIRYAHSIRHTCTELRMQPANLGTAVIVGGSPSVKNHLNTIRTLRANPENAVFAINDMHHFLIDQGITPTDCVMFEIDLDPTLVHGPAHPDITYHVCSMCHDVTFKKLEGFKKSLWHSWSDQPKHMDLMNELFGPDHMIIGGGFNTFMRSLNIALVMGYRHFEIFGADSSFPEDSTTHVVGNLHGIDPDKDGMDVWCVKTDMDGKPTNERIKFRTLGYLVRQAEEFRQFCMHHHWMFRAKVHGDGLLPYIHRTMYPQAYQEAA